MHDWLMGGPKPVPLDFAGIVGLWPSVRAFCDSTGTPDATVRAWRNRGRIPPEHWDRIIAAARSANIRLSLDTMMAALRIAVAREAEEQRQRRATAAAAASRDRLKNRESGRPRSAVS